MVDPGARERRGSPKPKLERPPLTPPRSEPREPTQPRAEGSTSIDRALKANLAPLTFGLSPAILAEQTFDWPAHIAISSSKQLQLIDVVSRGGSFQPLCRTKAVSAALPPGSRLAS